MGDTWRSLFSQLKRERLLAVTNIIVMTITFLVFAMFILVVAFSHTALKQLENQAQITVFFKDDYPENSILELKTALEADERISQVIYVSKQDAFNIFTEIHKDEPTLLKAASPSILPASLEVKTKNIAKLSELSDELTQKDGVEEVKFYKDVIERFRHWGNIIYLVGGVLVTLFLIISYSIVLVTLRLTINSKGTELEILKLVGASDAYVKSPLILQGVFFGAFSSLLSAFFVTALSVVLRAFGLFSSGVALGPVSLNFILFTVLLGLLLVISGTLLGYFGSSIAIKKYLKY